jgi:hypothetical protein
LQKYNFVEIVAINKHSSFYIGCNNGEEIFFTLLKGERQVLKKQAIMIDETKSQFRIGLVSQHCRQTC